MMNKNNMKIINSLAYFSPYFVKEEGQKPYLSKVAKGAFHSKVAPPKIFLKKINLDKAKIIPLNTPNNLGHIKHFPAATKEWSSSIYAHYNNNHIKSLPLIDKNLVKLIKSYFNFYHQSEKLKSERILLRFRRISLKKVFVSKAELKHTNSKVVINIHVYNLQIRLIMEEFFFILVYAQTKGIELENIICAKQRRGSINDEDKVKNEKRKKEFIAEQLLLFSYYINLYKLYIESKFDSYIPKLMEVIRKIYKKKVEINIVILKHMYLNSDILSQAIALKLKDRDNRVWRVLRSCLGMVQVPNTNKFKEKSKASRAESLVDKIKKLDLYSLTSYSKEAKSLLSGPALKKAYLSSFTKYRGLAYEVSLKQNNDSLNQLLFGIFPIMPTLRSKGGQGWSFFVKNCLKYKAIAGVRLEAKGRLTRRFTASRSVFKLTWKGGLKNIDSSYKGLSAVILRGHVKSNVQYSLTHSKNRIGAYGVKGWVSGK